MGKRVIATQTYPENIDFSVPDMIGRHRIDTFESKLGKRRCEYRLKICLA
jgi:hypothetical protein